MGKLDQATGYMSGAMEFTTDHGIGWRRKFIDLSNDAGLNIHYIDPTNKPGGRDIKMGEDKSMQEQMQKEGRFDELRAYVADYRRYDLRFVDISDFSVVSITPTIPQWGTANELYEMERQHKPRLGIIKGGFYQLPRWLFDVFGPDDLFETEQDVIDHLVKLDQGVIELDKRWVLVRKHIIEQQKEYQKS